MARHMTTNVIDRRMQPSRRGFLSLPAAAAASSAGCLGNGEDSTTEQNDGVLQNTEQNPSFEKLRNSSGEMAVRSSAVEPDEEAGWAPMHWLINSAKDYFVLDIPSEVEGRTEVRGMLENTDFSTNAVLVHQYNVEECLTRDVKKVQWDETGVRIEYVARDRQTDCEADAFDVEATFVRIPGEVRELGNFESSVS